MARTNKKYTSINYNHILHKDHHPSPSSSSSASYSSVARSNGRMLVLTKPSPKPLKSHVPAPAVTTTTVTPTISPDPNQISLRPLGNTGPGSSLSFPARTPETSKDVAATAPISVSSKPDRFVPPHLRPGFVPKDPNPKPGLDSSQVRDPNTNPSQRFPHQEQQPRQGYFGYGQTGRPKSGGYERIRSDPDHFGRPRSSGNRPGTSG